MNKMKMKTCMMTLAGLVLAMAAITAAHCTWLTVAIHRESGTEGVETAVAVFRIDGLAIIISCKSHFQMSVSVPHVGNVILEGKILLDVRSCIHYSLPPRLAYREGQTSRNGNHIVAELGRGTDAVKVPGGQHSSHLSYEMNTVADAVTGFHAIGESKRMTAT